MLNQEEKNTLLEHTDFWFELASEIYRTKLSSPPVFFDLKGRAAGMACFIGNSPTRIRYNEILFQENRERFLQRTVPHEVAHVVAAIIYPQIKMGHNNAWRSIMREFKVDDSRCHTYDTSNSVGRRVLRPYKYHCGCSGKIHNLTARLHNKILSGQYRICLTCKQRVYRCVEVSYQ